MTRVIKFSIDGFGIFTDILSVMIANGETEKAQAHAVARIEQIKAEELAKHQAQNRFCPIEQINAIRSPYLQ